MMPFLSDRSPGWRTPIERVIVFDLDDTLYLERDYVLSGLHAVGKWADGQIGTLGLGMVMQERFLAGARTRIFDESLADLGLHPSESTIARMLATYRHHRPQIRLAEDAAAFLADPPARTAIVIITDGFIAAQKRKIRALGLFRRGILLGVCTDQWGREHWKPHPRAFLRVQNFFDLRSSCFTYVADNPQKDFVAPSALGWQTIQIIRTGRIMHPCGKDIVPAASVIETLASL